MKVQLQNQQNYPIRNEKQNVPAFKAGSLSGALNFFATNQGWGANSTDVAFMVAPRTGKDFGRGLDAGFETAFRESMGTVNDSSIGLYGVGAGALLGGSIAGTYGVKVNQLFTSSKRVNVLAKLWEKHLSNNSSEKDYLANVVDEIYAYNTSRNKESGFIKIPNDKDHAKIIDMLHDAINNDMDMNKWRKCPEKGVLNAIITENTGAEMRFKIGNSGETNLNTVLDDIVGITKAFKQDKVRAAFQEALSTGQENKFLKSFSKFNKGRALIGFLIGSAVGLSVQPFNMWMTKKRTGKEGFVGGSCCEKDNSLPFKLEKLGLAAFMVAMVLASLKCKPKDFIDRMAFQGKSPTIDQLKGVYGVTVTGRILVARNKDEAHESCRKDFFGFISWLVLGDFVNRGVAASFCGKKLLNYCKAVDKNAITSSTLKSRSEVLREALREKGISTIKVNLQNGIKKALSISEMIKVLETSPAAKEIVGATKKKLRILNIAQLAGYAFTGSALGLGIPTLNIYMTKKAEARRAQKAKELEQTASQSVTTGRTEQDKIKEAA